MNEADGVSVRKGAALIWKLTCVGVGSERVVLKCQRISDCPSRLLKNEFRQFLVEDFL